MSIATRRPLVRLTVALTAGLSLVSCQSDGLADPGGDALSPASASVTIGIDGGTIYAPDRSFELTVPWGALSEPVQITVTRVDDPADQSREVAAVEADRVYRLEPSGLRFALPVSLEINMPPNREGHPPMLVLHGAGGWEAPQSQVVTIHSTATRLSATFRNLSDVVVKAVDEIRVTGGMPRSAPPGQTLNVDLTVIRYAAPWPAEVAFGVGDGYPSWVQDWTWGSPSLRVVRADRSPVAAFDTGAGGSVTAQATILCEPGAHDMVFGTRVSFPRDPSATRRFGGVGPFEFQLRLNNSLACTG